MRRMMKKWGESLLAALCVLAIVFAALYTRQDDLKRMAARDAAASQDETLEHAAPPWSRPTEGAVLKPFSGAGARWSGRSTAASYCGMTTARKANTGGLPPCAQKKRIACRPGTSWATRAATDGSKSACGGTDVTPILKQSALFRNILWSFCELI